MRPVDTWTLTSGFGYRIHPITGEWKFHNGIDLAVPVGTPIRSPEGGVVSGWTSNSVGGLQMLVDHDNGYRTGYAHLNERIAGQGNRVEKGDVIAYSGNTGASTGAHLHFTMKDETGQFVDPDQDNLYESSPFMLPEFVLESTRTYWWLVGSGLLAITAMGIYRARR